MFFKYIIANLLFTSFAFAVISNKGNEAKEDNEYVETSTGKFQIDCIKWHNYYRKLHGSPPLKHSAKLEDFARNRAIEIAVKDGTNFYHPDDLEYGENLAWNSIERVDCRIPLELWYDEWKIYNFAKPNITSRNGHFTQVVWKDTRRIGCGQAISKGKVGGTFTVCNYDPPGNYLNEELENVKPILKKKFKPTSRPVKRTTKRKSFGKTKVPEKTTTKKK